MIEWRFYFYLNTKLMKNDEWFYIQKYFSYDPDTPSHITVNRNDRK